ncbi:iron-sulfur cluster assembly 1 homolog, mitochondrial-like [Montipora capricornis]|uniref:iron-sulfur cluster assembly 1 homolog, mitochondrial-like n=2 Tax=Montipora TaxID=46703 RepID=UPI0035F1F025
MMQHKLDANMAARSAVGATVRAVSRPRKFAARRAAITLSPAAVEKLKSLLKSDTENTALRIGVKQKGCNGLSYTLEYTSEKGKFDEEVNQDGVKVYIDSKAQLSLLGTEMDYVEHKLASEFVFNNPNIKGTCGCGESFHL